MSTYPTSSPSFPNATCTSWYVPNGSEPTFAQPLTPESTKKSSAKKSSAKKSSAKPKSKSKSPSAFDEAGNKIKRPLNKFLLYRKEMAPKLVAQTMVTDHRQISRMVAAAWRELGPAGQQPWADQADAAQRRHQQMYPSYKFQPKPKGECRKRKTYGNTEIHLEYIAQLGRRAAANQDLSEIARAFRLVKHEPRPRRSRKSAQGSPAASSPSPTTAVRAASEDSYSSGWTEPYSLPSLPSSAPSPPLSLDSPFNSQSATFYTPLSSPVGSNEYGTLPEATVYPQASDFDYPETELSPGVMENYDLSEIMMKYPVMEYGQSFVQNRSYDNTDEQKQDRPAFPMATPVVPDTGIDYGLSLNAYSSTDMYVPAAGAYVDPPPAQPTEYDNSQKRWTPSGYTDYNALASALDTDISPSSEFYCYTHPFKYP